VFKNRPIFPEIPSSERKVLPLLRAAIAIGSTPVQRKWHNKKCELGGSDAGRGSGRGFAADGGQQLTRKQRISSEIQTHTHAHQKRMTCNGLGITTSTATAATAEAARETLEICSEKSRLTAPPSYEKVTWRLYINRI